jgi:hypothetical protein
VNFHKEEIHLCSFFGNDVPRRVLNCSKLVSARKEKVSGRWLMRGRLSPSELEHTPILKAVFFDPCLLTYFESYLESKWCIENLSFVKEVQKYRECGQEVCFL